MTPSEIKQDLNLAQAELQRCYRELRRRNNTVRDLVNAYSEAQLKPAESGERYCWEKESGCGNTCYFKCDECKMKDHFQSQTAKQLPASPERLFSNYPLFYPN